MSVSWESVWWATFAPVCFAVSGSPVGDCCWWWPADVDDRRPHPLGNPRPAALNREYRRSRVNRPPRRSRPRTAALATPTLHRPPRLQNRVSRSALRTKRLCRWRQSSYSSFKLRLRLTRALRTTRGWPPDVSEGFVCSSLRPIDRAPVYRSNDFSVWRGEDRPSRQPLRGLAGLHDALVALREPFARQTTPHFSVHIYEVYAGGRTRS